jgi:hypothetical protein
LEVLLTIQWSFFFVSSLSSKDLINESVEVGITFNVIEGAAGKCRSKSDGNGLVPVRSSMDIETF